MKQKMIKITRTAPTAIVFKIKNAPLSLWVRAFSILSVFIYIISAYNTIFLFEHPSREAITKAFFAYLTYGLICNLGLFFITTKWAKKTRMATTILYLPTFFITPIAMGFYSNSITGIVFDFSVLYLYLLPFQSVEKTIMKIPFFTLENEVTDEIYILIDKHLKPLPKNPDGSIDKEADGFQHNDVDALRHAYASGVFHHGIRKSLRSANDEGKGNTGIEKGWHGQSRVKFILYRQQKITKNPSLSTKSSLPPLHQLRLLTHMEIASPMKRLKLGKIFWTQGFERVSQYPVITQLYLL